jgi:prefoldin subunit 5
MPFGKKKAAGPERAGAFPTQRVVELSSQGLSEPEIIRELKNEGYSPMEVDRAMKEALRDSTVRAATAPVREPPRFPPMPAQQERKRVFPEPMEPRFDEQPEMAEQRHEAALPEIPGFEPRPRPPVPGFQRGPRQFLPPRDEEETEEIPHLPVPGERRPITRQMERRRLVEEVSEAIIEEKWHDFRRELRDVNDKMGSLKKKMDYLEESLAKIQEKKGDDVEEIEAKIDTYKQSFSELSGRMEAMERAMKDSLTPMMQTLRALTEAIKDIKSTGRKA